jgi:predicted RNase H-like nuclease
MDIVGIDCSTDARHVGLALYKGETNAISSVACGGKSAVETIEGWVRESERVLLAFDAPLGWPSAFTELAGHRAGERVIARRDEAFNRVTDRFVKKEVGQQPLRVGADLIAMTAHWALNLLGELRQRTGLPIPLAWSPNFPDNVAAIEVYPAATLRSCGFRCAGYKKDGDVHQAARQAITEELATEIDFREVQTEALRNADVLDAIVCCLAGRDFLEGRAFPPADETSSRKEGWIWVRRPGRGNTATAS